MLDTYTYLNVIRIKLLSVPTHFLQLEELILKINF